MFVIAVSITMAAKSRVLGSSWVTLTPCSLSCCGENMDIFTRNGSKNDKRHRLNKQTLFKIYNSSWKSSQFLKKKNYTRFIKIKIQHCAKSHFSSIDKCDQKVPKFVDAIVSFIVKMTQSHLSNIIVNVASQIWCQMNNKKWALNKMLWDNKEY